MKILIADDELRLRKVVALYLRKFGHEVIEASNGSEAIALAENIKPDVIILDVSMPVMDGIEALRRLRANHLFANTPIIMLTANSGEEDQKIGKSAGANSYMTKPFSPKELIDIIETITTK